MYCGGFGTCSGEKKGSQEGGARSRAAVPLLANGSSALALRDEPDQAGASQGQLVEIKFKAPRAGKYDLTLLCISGKLFACLGSQVVSPMRTHRNIKGASTGIVLRLLSSV